MVSGDQNAPLAIWPPIVNTAPCSPSITSWNRSTGRSGVGSTRVSIFADSGPCFGACRRGFEDGNEYRKWSRYRSPSGGSGSV
jgi:hypothetical protein